MSTSIGRRGFLSMIPVAAAVFEAGCNKAEHPCIYVDTGVKKGDATLVVKGRDSIEEKPVSKFMESSEMAGLKNVRKLDELSREMAEKILALVRDFQPVFSKLYKAVNFEMYGVRCSKGGMGADDLEVTPENFGDFFEVIKRATLFCNSDDEEKKKDVALNDFDVAVIYSIFRESEKIRFGVEALHIAKKEVQKNMPSNRRTEDKPAPVPEHMRVPEYQVDPRKRRREEDEDRPRQFPVAGVQRFLDLLHS